MSAHSEVAMSHKLFNKKLYFHLYQYNLQYLLQSKPIVSQDHGFTCKFKTLGKDTLMDCKTYPSNSK